MKKGFTLVLATALALSLVACGEQKQNTSSSSGETPQSKVETSSQTNAEVTGYFGKISSVAGNEIEINLVKEPEMPEKPESTGQNEGSIAATELTPATPSTEAGVGGGATERTELEYTGETKAFIIPAGMPIHDAMGNEKQLSDIKKGSIMNVFADANGNVTEVYLYE